MEDNNFLTILLLQCELIEKLEKRSASGLRSLISLYMENPTEYRDILIYEVRKSEEIAGSCSHVETFLNYTSLVSHIKRDMVMGVASTPYEHARGVLMIEFAGIFTVYMKQIELACAKIPAMGHCELIGDAIGAIKSFRWRPVDFVSHGFLEKFMTVVNGLIEPIKMYRENYKRWPAGSEPNLRSITLELCDDLSKTVDWVKGALEEFTTTFIGEMALSEDAPSMYASDAEVERMLTTMG